MGAILGTLAFAVMGGLLIFGGIQTMRNGIEIIGGKRLTGPGATVLAIVMILIGIAVPIGAAIWLFSA